MEAKAVKNKKGQKNGAAGKFFGPSYFDPALENLTSINCKNVGYPKMSTSVRWILQILNGGAKSYYFLVKII